MDPLVILFVLCIVTIMLKIIFCSPEDNVENFGALQSLYSNDGIQDQYLTIDTSSRGHYRPYKYWDRYPWNLPTRNLNRVVFYPYMYEYYFDRYGTLYPYW